MPILVFVGQAGNESMHYMYQNMQQAEPFMNQHAAFGYNVVYYELDALEGPTQWVPTGVEMVAVKPGDEEKGQPAPHLNLIDPTKLPGGIPIGELRAAEAQADALMAEVKEGKAKAAVKNLVLGSDEWRAARREALKR